MPKVKITTVEILSQRLGLAAVNSARGGKVELARAMARESAHYMIAWREKREHFAATVQE